MMRRLICVTACIAIGLVSGVLATRGDGGEEPSWTVKTVLKQMEKATKDLHTVKAEVQWDELLGQATTSGSGQIYVRFDGRMRADIGGDNPRVILAVSPDLYVYRKNDKTVEIYYMAGSPDLMGQYALLGFAPTGSAMKENYKVKLVRTEMLDDRTTHVLSLTPKPKAKVLEKTISSIVIWVDEANWLPAQQMIRHKSGLQATLHYHGMTPTDDLPTDLFRINWPAGTTVIKK